MSQRAAEAPESTKRHGLGDDFFGTNGFFGTYQKSVSYRDSLYRESLYRESLYGRTSTRSEAEILATHDLGKTSTRSAPEIPRRTCSLGRPPRAAGWPEAGLFFLPPHLSFFGRGGAARRDLPPPW